MAKTNKGHRFLGSSETLNYPKTRIEEEPGYTFEFDESEVWPTNDVITTKNNNKIVARPLRKPKTKTTTATKDRELVGPKSLPVNIPDWSKILRGEYRKHGGGGAFGDQYEDDDDDVHEVFFDGRNDRIPPHEYLARTRGASFSVHEGVGRTLKGRDLSRVRNAIWKQTGFED